MLPLLPTASRASRLTTVLRTLDPVTSNTPNIKNGSDRSRPQTQSGLWMIALFLHTDQGRYEASTVSALLVLAITANAAEDTPFNNPA